MDQPSSYILPKPELPIPGTLCPAHTKPAKWLCGGCGEPVCAACQPVAFDYKVFHKECVDKPRLKTMAPAVAAPVDAPSLGVKAIGWLYLLAAMLCFGMALLLTGVALFSHYSLPMANWLGQSLPGLDDVPGGRTTLVWIAAFLLGVSVLDVFLGLGVINCVEGARQAILLLAWLEILVAVFGWLFVLALRSGFWDIPILPAALIIFFSRKSVKLQFQRPL